MQINPRTSQTIGTEPRGDEQGGTNRLFLLHGRVIFNPYPRVGKNTYIKSVQQQKPITPPAPIPLHNKLFYWSGDNYLSHIIKHLEQIGGSNYRLPLGYPSSFIVLLLYITWWDLLCHAFPLHFSLALCWDTLTKGFGGQMHPFKVICHLFSVFTWCCVPLQTQIVLQ